MFNRSIFEGGSNGMSALQFNLLPDQKLEHTRQQRTRRLISSAALLTAGVALAIFVLLLFSVDIIQKKQLNDSGKELDKVGKQLNSIDELGKIVTVQNQLKVLSGLHQNKHITSRIFGFLPQVTPANVSINKLDLDVKQGTLSLTGTADSQASINSFIDTLKVTTYKINDTDTPATAFPSVVESAFNINPKNVTYSINMQVDTKLFANNLTDSQGKPASPKLIVPKFTNNAGQTNPNSLFNGAEQ